MVLKNYTLDFITYSDHMAFAFRCNKGYGRLTSCAWSSETLIAHWNNNCAIATRFTIKVISSLNFTFGICIVKEIFRRSWNGIIFVFEKYFLWRKNVLMPLNIFPRTNLITAFLTWYKRHDRLWNCLPEITEFFFEENRKLFAQVKNFNLNWAVSCRTDEKL